MGTVFQAGLFRVFTCFYSYRTSLADTSVEEHKKKKNKKHSKPLHTMTMKAQSLLERAKSTGCDPLALFPVRIIKFLTLLVRVARDGVPGARKAEAQCFISCSLFVSPSTW